MLTICPMNDTDLDRLLKRIPGAGAFACPPSMESEVMARVRVDEGRALRWRLLLRWLLLTAAVSAMLTAGAVGWSLAKRDTTHTTPPPMSLFREGEAR